MEESILYPSVEFILGLSLVLSALWFGMGRFMQERIRLPVILLAVGIGISITVVSYRFSLVQSTGAGFWTYRGWPHWFAAYWVDYNTGAQSGGLNLGPLLSFLWVNIIFWAICLAWPIELVRLYLTRKLFKKRGLILLGGIIVCVMSFCASLIIIYRHVQTEGSKYLYTNWYRQPDAVISYVFNQDIRADGSIPVESVDYLQADYRVAIIFGAGLTNGRPSDVLTDRVKTGVELYEQGIVEKLLMSGDNRFVQYNEPAAMQKLAVELGVPVEDIVLDYAGRRTYDTCYRAQEIFGLEEAILITNEFHLPRALYTCNALGITSVGIASDKRSYIGESSWAAREFIASIVAWIDVSVTHPEPILGVKEPIYAD
ncbi:MAG TPA: ElyC/SanA/YdcF family protein [bacterium]|nr:ElyC/SanA/YdcF family protein [bacterium]